MSFFGCDQAERLGSTAGGAPRLLVVGDAARAQPVARDLSRTGAWEKPPQFAGLGRGLGRKLELSLGTGSSELATDMPRRHC